MKKRKKEKTIKNLVSISSHTSSHTLNSETVDVTVIRRDLVLTIFRKQFSLYKSFRSFIHKSFEY